MDRLAASFWNIRGTHRIAGLIDIGTHMSLARRGDGRFVVIDGCGLDDARREAVMALTRGGDLVDAVIHVHPFHTLHVEATHRLFPAAPMHGTARHRERFPTLPWSQVPVEHWRDDHPLSDVLELSVPDGVHFVCADEHVHVASVLVRHRPSAIVHVDDTLNVMALPGPLARIFPTPALRMHPRLSRALKPTAGAADAYAAWARGLASRWSDSRIVCAAHSAVRHLPEGGFQREVEAALHKAERVLRRHRARYG